MTRSGPLLGIFVQPGDAMGLRIDEISAAVLTARRDSNTAIVQSGT